jgi:hypothetical protein
MKRHRLCSATGKPFGQPRRGPRPERDPIGPPLRRPVHAIGTSGAVYPAAGFVAEAGALGIATFEINLEPADNAELFGERRYGRAGEVLPRVGGGGFGGALT